MQKKDFAFWCGTALTITGIGISVIGPVSPWIGYGLTMSGVGILLAACLKLQAVRKWQPKSEARLGLWVAGMGGLIWATFGPISAYVAGRDLGRDIELAAERGSIKALSSFQKPDFVANFEYRQNTAEIVLNIRNTGNTTAHAIREDRWVEVGHINYSLHGDDVLPKTKFEPMYSTKKGLTVIKNFVPSAGSFQVATRLEDMAPGQIHQEVWLDQTSDFLKAIGADNQSVLRNLGTLQYTGSRSDIAVFSFCVEVRFMKAVNTTGVSHPVLLSCE